MLLKFRGQSENLLSMKKIYRFLLAIGFVITIFMTFGARCRSYNELGPDSAFFKFNGAPVIPWHVLVRPDSLAMVEIGVSDSIILHFYPVNYHGVGHYDFRPGDTVPYVDCEYFGKHSDNYYTIPLGNTYIEVLEHDTLSGLFHAVFEAHLADSSGHTVHITEGRVFINVPDNY